MPRRAPDNVTEHRITFGNYERNFIGDIREDVEKGLAITTISAVAVPVATVIGAGLGSALLGYGIYRGLDNLGFGNAKDAVETVVAIKDSVMNWAAPEKEYTANEVMHHGRTQSELNQLTLYFWTGGLFGKSNEEINAARGYPDGTVA